MKVNVVYNRHVLANGDFVTSADLISDKKVNLEDVEFSINEKKIDIKGIKEIENGYHFQFGEQNNLSTLQFDMKKFVNEVVLPQILLKIKGTDAEISVAYKKDPFISDFKNRILQTNKIQLSYLIDDYGNKDKKRPLVLFLHGSGERGFGTELPLLGNDVPKIYHDYIRKEKQGAVIVVPQATWAPTLNGWFRKEFRKAIFKLLTKVKEDYNIDQDRIYLSGLSNGASTSWYLGAHHPETFAAIIPCSGFVYDDNKKELGNMQTGRYMEVTEKEADALATVPIWAFHSEDDPTVSVEGTKKAKEAIDKIDSSKLKVTIYPRNTVLPNPHASWSHAYHTPELLPWLFSQSRVGQNA